MEKSKGNIRKRNLPLTEKRVREIAREEILNYKIKQMQDLATIDSLTEKLLKEEKWASGKDRTNK